jgi:transposase
LGGMSDAVRDFEIPDDLQACQALLEQLLAKVEAQNGTIATHTRTIDAHLHTIESHARTIDELQKEKEELKLTVVELLQRAFRRRSERYLADPNQLRLDFGDTPEAADAAEGLAEAIGECEAIDECEAIGEQTAPQPVRRRRPRKARREKLPEHLPRYEVEAPTPDEVTNCPQHGPRKLIGYDVTETLELERPKLRVRVTKYPKYACEDEPQCGVASPERPTGLVEGDRYDTSVAAEVITGKYGFHLPTYRQQDSFAGSGWTPARSTLLNLLVAAAFVIRPLCEHFKQLVLAGELLGTDDTTVTLLLPKNTPQPVPGDAKSERIFEVFSKARAEGKPSVSARMWAYRSLTIPLNVFDFTVSHHRDGPDLFLAGFRGKLLGDCYSGYQGIDLRSAGAIERGACNAHARRKVFDARDVYPRQASELLAMYQQLYDLEERAKIMSPEERQLLREREAEPVWQSLRAWLDRDAASDTPVLPKSKLGQALTYLRNHWEALRLYLRDGRLPIDNNDVEQLMKQIALGRKNWLFIGSVAAGERTADFMTLVSSAVRNDLDVWAYVKDVLDQLLAGSTDYESLRPDVWKQSHPESIREYRELERRDRADRQQARRAHRRQRSH